MPILQPLSIAKFRDISWTEFLETEEFSEECFMSSEFGPLDEPPATFLYDKIIRDFVANKNLTKKKKIVLFSFSLNSFFTRLKFCESTINIHIIGVFLFLIELEEQFEKPIIKKGKKTNFNKDEILLRKFFFDLKRRVFNIFLYFQCYPKALEEHLENLIASLANIDLFRGITINVSKNDLDNLVARLQFKKKRCLLEYFKHYTWFQEKSGAFINYSAAFQYYDQVPLCIKDIVIKNKDILFSKKASEILKQGQN